MIFNDLREFLNHLESKNLLKRVRVPVDANLEIAGIMGRLVKKGGPAVIFENVKGYTMPVVANLFGTEERVAIGLDITEDEFIEIGKWIAYLQRPKPPEGLWETIKSIPSFGKMLMLNPKTVRSGPCQEVVLQGDDVDLSKFPIIKCWPGDAGPLITWPLVITQGHDGGQVNVGVYRMQYLDKKRVIMRWLKHRGGAHHQRLWQEKGLPMPVAVAIGCEPATIIAAVTPVPEDVSEFLFAGILRKKAIELVECKTNSLKVPATAEIVFEGEIRHEDTAMEGPFGDHTGYYNSAEPFPVFHIKCITHRKNPLYLTTITGRPPKEDAIIGMALNKMFLPSLQLQFPEVVDFSLPMEAVSYRIAVVSIKKQYPGHAKRIMMGIWGVLKQFMYVKYIIVVDDDINVHDWNDVVWAISTRVDPKRDVMIIEDTPIDYLDFSSTVAELGSKMGIDATMKKPPEVSREWGKKIEMDKVIEELINKRWKEYGLD
ncbi:MAG: menaquinone biosynthesis decarboxylase [Deltaproteobacteria bacterium]|nr:menaquinone biosynthesis decarboxylase [Deltaproteobacteria bacterium]